LREYKSAKYLADFLKSNGFEVEMDIADLGPSSFLATYGSGEPVVATYLEYDACAGYSQDAVPYRKPIIPHGPGFLDAHNMLGVAAAFGFVGAKEAMEKHGLKGTLKAFGTTFEKQNLGKVWIARYGYLDDLDAVIGWHPGWGSSSTCLWEMGPLPYVAICFEFQSEGGPGQRPFLGRSTLDAAVSMHNLVNQQKEHLIGFKPYSIDEIMLVGGQEIDVLPDISQIVFCCRAPTIELSEKAEKMLRNCAKAAALATGCEVKEHLISRLRHFNPNHVMARMVYRNLELAGPPNFSEEDKKYAREIQRNLGFKPMDEPLNDTIIPPWEVRESQSSSSDDSNEFSWYAPTARLYVNFSLNPYPDYSYPWWVHSALCAKGPCHKMGATVAKTIALSTVELMTNPSELQKAKEEFESRPKTPIRVPEGLKPPVNLRWPEWVDNRYPAEMSLENRRWYLYPR
jgi:aminobenzoyl-glutamate utilization protein B